MRKKYIAAAIASVMILGVLTGCGLAGGKDIGRDAALEAALNDAGVNEADTTRLKVSEDRDDGRKIYEVRFDVDGKEYDYEIQASDGAILSADIESIAGYASGQEQNQNGTNGQDTAPGQGNAAGNTTGNTNGNAPAQNAGGTNSANVAVSVEEAIQIALERVPGATDKDVRIELDYDDGQYKYEGNIIHEQLEYDFEIDANTGTILEWSEERR